MPHKVGLLKDFTEKLNDITEPGKKKLILRDEFVIQGVIELMWMNVQLF